MRIVDQLKQLYHRPDAPEPNQVSADFTLGCLETETEGDGMLFAALMENRLLHAASNDSWYVWGGHAWRRDKTNMVPGLVRHVTDRYGQAIRETEEEILKNVGGDADERAARAKRLQKRITRLERKISALRMDKGRAACLKFAATFLGSPLAIEGNEFDKNPWLLGVRNGVVDLRAGTLMPGRPDQMISKQCACDYKPDIDTRPWLRFLADIYNDDRELMAFMQILFGYGLTGCVSEHVFPFLLGRGRNGKSLLINTISRVAGDYAATVPCEIFLKSNTPRTPNQTDPAIMKHEGLRFAFSSEVEEGARFSAQAVKRMTGGDNLDGRNPYDKEWREFKPTHLSIMVGNHEPLPPAGDPAFWDRTFLIYHPVRFVKHDPDPAKMERQADPDMEAKLEKMDEQVLAWMVEGAVRWYTSGSKIRPPACVLKSTEEYREDSDWLERFLDACCVRGPEWECGSTTLYVAFTLWYLENINSKKSAVPSHRAFGLKMKARCEFTPVRNSGGIRYKGLDLTETWRRRAQEQAFEGEP